MPRDHGCGLDQYHRVDDLGPNPIEQHPLRPIQGRKLRSAGALSAQNGQLVLKNNNLEFERSAAAETKTKIDKTAKRIVTMTVTVRPARENHQPLSALWRF